MLDQTFVKKKMKKVIANYLQDPEIQLSDQEIDALLTEFNHRVEGESEESIHFILHDLIYEYLTTNYFSR